MDERDERRVDGDETFRNSFRRRRGAPDETGRERARGDDAMGEWTDATWRRGGSAGGLNARTCASEVRSFMNIRDALFLFSSRVMQ